MLGQMMDRPLLISDIIRFAADSHRGSGIVSSTVEGGIHRASYTECLHRSAQLAQALNKLGVAFGDRVATLAWNGYRHFELYYGISGSGAVCHTINPRLPMEQISYIVDHAENKLIFADLTFVPLVAQLLDLMPSTTQFVIMTDRSHMPNDAPAGALCYEDLLSEQDGDYEWPEFDENTAAGLCYTSGTTGNPKGSLYSHRSTVLHGMYLSMSLPTAFRPDKNIMPVVPQFHVKAWGIPYAAPMTGASMIMPGSNLDGASLFNMMDSENVHSSFGVPTVWIGLLDEIRKRGRSPKSLSEVVIGGAAAPRSMFAGYDEFGVKGIHVWGMTEMSPIGTLNQLGNEHANLSDEQKMDIRCTQGRRIFGVDLKIVDESGARLPHDGEATGELFVRGSAIISSYFQNEEATKAAFDSEGWFGTGDVCSISPDGYLTITDRAKDLIKSGGEWISSIDLENVATAHSDVASCAVIAIPHSKWGERPLLVIVPTKGAATTDQSKADITASVIELLGQSFAKWQLPDDVVYVDALPLTATGKVSKRTLRDMFKDHKSSSLQ